MPFYLESGYFRKSFLKHNPTLIGFPAQRKRPILSNHNELKFNQKCRYYDPYSTKFLSEDPIGFTSGDFNLYRYVENNPLVAKDPEGKFLIPALRWVAGWFIRKVAKDSVVNLLSPDLDKNEDRDVLEDREKERRKREQEDQLCGVTMSCEPKPTVPNKCEI